MKILFLDDDENRHKRFRQRMTSKPFSPALTAEGAIEILEDHPFKEIVFNIVSLDHDLCGGVFEPSDEKSGAEVARYIAVMDNPPQKVVLHSYNEKGVAEMAAILWGAECKIVVAPFDTEAYWKQFEVKDETHN